MQRKSRRGKVFYSCSTYPTWRLRGVEWAVAEPRPNCGWPVLTIKTTKRSGQKVCPQQVFAGAYEAPSQEAADTWLGRRGSWQRHRTDSRCTGQPASCRDGGIIAYPTEAVYGLGCDPLNGDAVHRLLALKQRPVEGLDPDRQPLRTARPFIPCRSRTQYARLEQTWPGPATWLPANPATPTWLRGRHSFRSRCVSPLTHWQRRCAVLGAP